MPTEQQTLRVAILAWEIGRVRSGLGAKIGGLGTIIEELPAELVKTARQQNIDLDIEILSPCFAHYDKRQLTRLDINPQVTLGGHTFPLRSMNTFLTMASAPSMSGTKGNCTDERQRHLP